MEDSKIAVFICNCKNQIGENIDLDELEKCIESSPGVISVNKHESLCSQDGLEFLKRVIKTSGAERVVVAACTPRTYEELIRNNATEVGINKNLYEQTGIREQCEWVHTNKPMGTTKATCLVKCAIAKIALSQKIDDEDIQIKNKSVLIIGGGIAGMKASLELARKGIHCYLIERDHELGGVVNKLSASAIAGMENELPKIEEVNNNSNIEVLLQSEVKDVKGWLGNYKVTIQSGSNDFVENNRDHPIEIPDENSDEQGDQEKDTDETQEIEMEKGEPGGALEVGGIIVATGSKIFDSHRIPEFRFEHDNVITSLDLEEMLKNNSVKCPSNDLAPKKINFIQCVGSRDENKGNPHCSVVCCTYAIRQARDIKAQYPETQIYIHYMDLRGPYPGFEESYQEAGELGIQFIRGRVAEIQNSNDKDKLVIRSENIDLDDTFSWDTDLVVLSVGQEPSENNSELSDLLHVPLDVDGFLGEYNYRWDIIDRRGISIAGSAQGPRNIRHALTDAKRSAWEIAEFLEFGAKTKEPHSVIDQNRCVGCGICEALCPFEAITLITIEDFETEEVKKVSEVDVSACQACGACAMACPSNVPVMSHLTADQILAEIDALT
jgi:heterodisulfide reductase subunit A